jgi:NAD(P)-dependent dehydrogenase (short-subunit alcohol dehydrogenase family)
MTNQNYKNIFDLSGKTALVTGAAGIIGTEIAHGLASFGANIALVDKDVNGLELLTKSIEDKFSVSVKGYECDISSKDEVCKTVAEISVHFGSVEILINNAAAKSRKLTDFFAPVEEFDIDEWKTIASVNLDGTFIVAQVVGSLMKNQGNGGSIIQTASIYGLLGPDHRIYSGSDYLGQEISSPAVYSATKAGVIGLTKYLATYWGQLGIRVNTLVPGGVRSGQNSIFQEKYSARVPMGRMGEASEMVGACIFLASDASSYVTGQEIIVDGGLSSW